jgi:hypothetical protein
MAALGVLVIIGVVVWLFNSPGGKRIMNSAFMSQAAIQEMQSLKGAIDKFHADKGRYPKALEELKPNYVLGTAPFRVGGKAENPKFNYTPPPKDASGSFVILSVDLPPPVPADDAPPWTLRMRLDGQVEGQNYEYRSGGGTFSTGPPR